MFCLMLALLSFAGKATEGGFPFLGLESALSALPDVLQQQRKSQQRPAEGAPTGSRNSLAASTATSTNAVAPTVNGASLVTGVVASGNGDMHPASAAYALNMRQHMLNQAYRNATASGQPSATGVAGVGAHSLLGRQAAPPAGPFDSAHGGHHGNSGILTFVASFIIKSSNIISYITYIFTYIFHFCILPFNITN